MSLLAGEPARLVTLFEKVYYKQTVHQKLRVRVFGVLWVCTPCEELGCVSALL